MRGNDSKSQPGLLEQLLVTVKVLLATGGVFGGIWLLDYIVSN